MAAKAKEPQKGLRRRRVSESEVLPMEAKGHGWSVAWCVVRDNYRSGKPTSIESPSEARRNISIDRELGI